MNAAQAPELVELLATCFAWNLGLIPDGNLGFRSYVACYLLVLININNSTHIIDL